MCSPGSPKGSTAEVELPGVEGEEHGAPHGELFTPIRSGITR